MWHVRLKAGSHVACRAVWYQVVGWHGRAAPPGPRVGWLCSITETVRRARGEWRSAGLISWHGFRAQPTQTHGTARGSGNQQASHSFHLVSVQSLFSCYHHKLAFLFLHLVFLFYYVYLNYILVCWFNISKQYFSLVICHCLLIYIL